MTFFLDSFYLFDLVKNTTIYVSYLGDLLNNKAAQKSLK